MVETQRCGGCTQYAALYTGVKHHFFAWACIFWLWRVQTSHHSAPDGVQAPPKGVHAGVHSSPHVLADVQGSLQQQRHGVGRPGQAAYQGHTHSLVNMGDCYTDTYHYIIYTLHIHTLYTLRMQMLR